MKIVHVVDSMEMGGAETVVSQMCRIQREQGHDPQIYAIAALGALGERMRAEGFTVRSNVGRHLQDASWNLFRMFRESRPHVAHLHNPTPTIYAAVAARMARVPSILSTRHSLVAPPHNRVMELKYALAARFCDWITGICDATTRNLISLGRTPPRKIIRVYNGAAPIQRTAAENRPAKTGFTLLYVGRLEPVKNHGLLLSGFREAIQSSPEIRLWMVGDGSERPRLEKLAAEAGVSSQVRFWGQQLDVAPFFSAADAFTMSSSSEGLPISLLQAFSLGLPAIVTDVGGMAEVVRLADAGVVVPKDDPAQFASAILQLATNCEQRARFTSNAQACFHSHFTLQRMVESYMDLYKEGLRRRRVNSN